MTGRLCVCLLLLFVWLLNLPSAIAGDTLKGTVVRVIDGDTLDVAGVGQVRLLGIDAPEWEASERDAFYTRHGISSRNLRNTARRAKIFNIDLVQGKRVALELDREPRDRHGRLLAYVRLSDGRPLNRLLLEKGLAAVYRKFDFELKQDFLQAEAKARRQRLGIWSAE